MYSNTQSAIVVGVDGTSASLAALRWAAAEARQRGSRLCVVRAWDPQFIAPYAPPADERARVDEYTAAARPGRADGRGIRPAAAGRSVQ